ncbi:hypothetical protein P9112_002944 [Eukaryota sp. TZLM1-RC]
MRNFTILLLVKAVVRSIKGVCRFEKFVKFHNLIPLFSTNTLPREVTTPVSFFPFLSFFDEEPYRNRRSDSSVGVEYCTFLSHHVSHDLGAVESAMVLITLDMGCSSSSSCFVLNCYFDVIEFVVFHGLAICTVDMGCCSGLCFVLHCCYFDVFDFVDVFGLSTCTLNMGCFSCLCFVLNCCPDVFGFVVFRGLRTCTEDVGCFFCICFVLHSCFDVYEFVHFCGLDSCTLDMGCCVLNCYFDNVEFDYYVYYLSFLSRSCQHLLSTNPFTVDLTIDGDVEANPGPRKRRSNFESTPPSKIIRNAIFDQQTSKRKRKKQQKALNREICIENTMLSIENRQILTKKPLKPNKVKKIEPSRSGFKPDPLIQFKSMTSNQHLPLLCALILKHIRMVIFIKIMMANFSLLTKSSTKREKRVQIF